MMKTGLLLLALLLIAAAAVPRMVSDDPAEWHVDPRTVTPPEKPNYHRLAGDDALSLPTAPAETLAQLDAIAMAEPRTVRVAFDSDAGRATYVQRSAIFGFPDYISISANPDGDGTALSLYSRSRFGHSDLGVNKSRIERWLSELRK